MAGTFDSLRLLRFAAHITVAGVGLSLVLQQTTGLLWVLAGLVVFDLILPLWPWTRGRPAPVLFSLVLGAMVLIALGMLVDGNPGTTMILFFVVLPIGAWLPRPYSLLCYALAPVLAGVTVVLQPITPTPWWLLLTVVPGYLATIALAEAFWQARWTARENQHLLDTLIVAQKQQVVTATEEALPAPSQVALTRRDREVLSLVAKGFSNREIAERLFIAEGTVKNRVSAILEKTGVRDRTQAALRARELGVV